MSYARFLAAMVAVLSASLALADGPTTRTTLPADNTGTVKLVVDPSGGGPVVGAPPPILTTRATTKPATKPTVQVSPEARQLLDQVRGAYDKLTSLQLEGTLTFDQDIAGDKESHKASFSAAFQAPNKFRHALKADGDDLLMGSTGVKLFAFIKARNSYFQADAPKERVATHDLPRIVGELLSSQNASLALAVSQDAAAELLEDVKAVEKIADTKIGDSSCPTLRLLPRDDTGQTAIVAIDPDTKLVRRFQMDFKAVAEKRGAPDVKVAMMTIDYTTSTPNVAMKDEQFAWAPPEGAKDIAAGPTAEESPAVALTGQAAPDFTLKDLDGKDVKLSDLKGTVVVLDFWATWCGPCRISLPVLDKTAKEFADKGVKVFAVNEAEDKDKAQGFMRAQKLSLNVLLDLDGSVGAKYQADAIPETVLVGKDGLVKKVLIGFAPTSEEQLKAAIESALK